MWQNEYMVRINKILCGPTQALNFKWSLSVELKMAVDVIQNWAFIVVDAHVPCTKNAVCKTTAHVTYSLYI